MFYCKDCELHLCDLCKAEKALKTELDVSAIKKSINETKTRFTDYILNIKDKLIEMFEKQIRLVKKVAEDRVKKNTQILNFYKNLVRSYESISNNFYLERIITNQKLFSAYNNYLDVKMFSYCETPKLLTKLKKISVLKKKYIILHQILITMTIIMN